MRRCVLVCVAAASLLPASAAAAATGPGGAGVLTATTNHGAGYAPTFTGNGFLGVRVPAAGQGYAGGSVPAQSELAGFYAQPTHPKTIADSVQQRANIPTWSTLLFGDGTQAFSPSTGTMSGWRQSLDLHTGIITTTVNWRATDGHAAKITYQVLTDRANEHLGIVHLTVIPQWTGMATITDEIDGSPATLTDQVAKGFSAAQRQDYVEVATRGTGIQASIASQLTTTPSITVMPTEVDATADQSIGQQITFPVSAGQSYTVTKYVGVDDSQDTANPVAAAQAGGHGGGGRGLRRAGVRQQRRLGRPVERPDRRPRQSHPGHGCGRL